MSTDLIMGIAGETMKVTLFVSAPILLVGLIVGIVISVFQAVTQVHEMTLTFVPKIIVVLVAFVLFLPWMVSVLMGFVEPLLGDFGRLIG